MNLTGTPSELPAVMLQYGKFGFGIFSFGASGVVPELSCDAQIAAFGVYCCEGLVIYPEIGKFLSLLGLDN
jgi:hypothetical protein